HIKFPCFIAMVDGAVHRGPAKTGISGKNCGFGSMFTAKEITGSLPTPGNIHMNGLPVCGFSYEFLLPIGISIFIPGIVYIIGIIRVFCYSIIGEGFFPHCKVLLGIE